MMQQLILLGTFFVLPVYLQVVLGLDAFETGKKLFPMSVTMFLAAMAGPRLAAGLAPKRVAQAGLVALAVASVLLLGTIDVELDETEFALALALFGDRRGPAALPARQRDHVVGRPVADERGRRPPGHRAEPRRVARHGADRLGPDPVADERAARTASSRTRRCRRPSASRSPRSRRQGIPVVPVDDVEQAALDAGRAGRGQAQAIADDYGDAQLLGLKHAIGAVAIFALLSLWFTRGLPGQAVTSPARRRHDELSSSISLIAWLTPSDTDAGVERAADRRQVAARARARGLGLRLRLVGARVGLLDVVLGALGAGLGVLRGLLGVRDRLLRLLLRGLGLALDLVDLIAELAERLLRVLARGRPPRPARRRRRPAAPRAAAAGPRSSRPCRRRRSAARSRRRRGRPPRRAAPPWR